MEFTISCPHCGSHKVRMHNPESLCENAYLDDKYVFDSVATTQGICDDCGNKCTTEGHIKWKQPKPEYTTLKVNICALFAVPNKNIKDLEEKIKTMLVQSGVEDIRCIELVEVSVTE